jgi:hypothetical protein
MDDQRMPSPMFSTRASNGYSRATVNSVAQLLEMNLKPCSLLGRIIFGTAQRDNCI